MDTRQRAAAVRLMAFDIDGVMTDGGLHYADDGQELKTFHVHDGLGIVMARRAGLHLAIVTGRRSPLVQRRADDLRINHVFQGVNDKTTAVAGLLDQLGLTWQDAAFMGDDLIDLGPMGRCGLAIAPANARPQALAAAHLVTEAAGGRGAVREAVEFVLAAQGKLEAACALYLASS